jgi:formamidopyrimidine-DNA glycosylase
MPELPEVETVRRSLEPHLVGRRVQRIERRRPDHVRSGAGGDLLAGRRIGRLLRHGKQLALVAAGPEPAPVVCLHLGMSGSVRWEPAGPAGPHDHLIWHLHGGGRLVLRDPRRFGGAWCFKSESVLWRDRWSRLGDDALSIRPDRLGAALSRTRRALKAALLDQQVIAGLGNIYTDELLFASYLHPEIEARALDPGAVRQLVRRLRRLLTRAIRAGGSSLRDHVDADGAPGTFQNAHRVYGRSGQPCPRCGTRLERSTVAGRGTSWCRRCQCPEGAFTYKG